MDQLNQTSSNQQTTGSQQQNQGQSQQKRSSWQESLQQINTFLVPAQEVLVLFKPNSSFDTVAGSLALAAGLKKIGRKVHVVCPGDLSTEVILKIPYLSQEEKNLLDFSQVVNFLPKKQLRLVIDYSNGSFSKGSIKKEGESLVLTLIPNTGESAIEPLNMVTQVLESKPDAAFFVECENVSHLQNFYTDNQAFFQKVPIVNIDFHQNNSLFGRANLIDPKASSVCEMITLMLYDLRFVIDQEMAKILYAGMKAKTENFAQNFYTANMLEAASICLRYQQPLSPVPPTQ